MLVKLKSLIEQWFNRYKNYSCFINRSNRNISFKVILIDLPYYSSKVIDFLDFQNLKNVFENDAFGFKNIKSNNMCTIIEEIFNNIKNADIEEIKSLYNVTPCSELCLIDIKKKLSKMNIEDCLEYKDYAKNVKLLNINSNRTKIRTILSLKILL